MIAIACGDVDATTTAISTYNLFYGTHIYSHHVSEGRIVAPIWTHSECLRFVTVKPGSITIWEVGFTSVHTLTEVESFPALNVDYSEECLFLPTLSRLAFTLRGATWVLDARDPKLLLEFAGGDQATRMSFSPDGGFFACGTIGLGVHLWKDSPAGYVLHQKFAPSGSGVVRPLLSPSGESMIMLEYTTIRLWRTSDPSPSLSNAPVQFVEPAGFFLEFSPDETLAAVVRLEEKTATVLDLRSGGPRLVIDTAMKILGMRITGSTIAVVGEGKVTTWNIPARDCGSDTRVNANDSVRTIMLDYSLQIPNVPVPCASISPDFNLIAVAGCTVEESDGMNIYDASTGEYLTGTTILGYMCVPWFTPDGCEVWCKGDFSAKGWKIVEDSESGLTRLEPLESTGGPPGGPPWRSSRGYVILDNGWVLNASGKRLLWLPHHWRPPDETDVAWGGQFLGLLHCGLPEAVILELDE